MKHGKYDTKYDKLCSIISIVFSGIFALFAGWWLGFFEWMADDSLGYSLIGTLIGYVVIFTIFFVLAIWLDISLVKLLTKKFNAEILAIVRDFDETKDAEKFYHALMNIQHRAKFRNDLNALYLNLSTALSHQGRTEEALEKLNEIQTDDKQLKMLIEKQRTDIMDKSG
ncbi:MAG: tetratricopeptide repeat protein [Lachnospiraceae bacterium]|nr:tetratricopeptide repeat protein [Lachnospiraceae bacterium]